MNAVNREPLPFNPAVLLWARKRAGLAREEVADKLGTNAERIAEWESPSAERQPTINQARRSNVDAVAARAREVSGFPIERQATLRANDKRLLPDMIRDAFESCGVLVLKQSGLGKARTRGICLYAEPVPVIVFGNEAPGAQAFTLAHEFGHILLKRSAISGSPRFGRASSPSKQIEGWCNRFAAAFLIPSSALAAQTIKPESPQPAFDDVALSDLAALFAVSRHAMMIRLVNLGYVEKNYYWRVKRPQFDKEERSTSLHLCDLVTMVRDTRTPSGLCTPGL